MVREKYSRESVLQPVAPLYPVQTLQIERRRNSVRRAVTFIDVAIVVMIIGLTAAISMPRVASVQRKNNLRNAAMMLAEHLRLARETAIARATPVNFVFNPTLATYESLQTLDPERPGETLRIDLRQRINSTISLTATFNGASTLVFGIDGLPRAAGQPVTSSSISIADSSGVETVKLLHGWGTAQWQAAGPGSRGAGG